jgi:hypothetical protein
MSYPLNKQRLTTFLSHSRRSPVALPIYAIVRSSSRFLRALSFMAQGLLQPRFHLSSYVHNVTLLLAGLITSSFDVPTCEARDFNVKGTLLFADGDPAEIPEDSMFPPLNHRSDVYARLVEVAIMQGNTVTGQGTTDSEGYFSINVTAPDNVNLTLAFEVENAFVHVLADTDCVDERLVGKTAAFISSGSSGDIDLGLVPISPSYTNITVGECLGNKRTYRVSLAAPMNINNVIATIFDDFEKNRNFNEESILLARFKSSIVTTSGIRTMVPWDLTNSS